MGRFKSTLGTIEHMRRLCYLGGHPEPAWLKAWMKCVLLQQWMRDDVYTSERHQHLCTYTHCRMESLNIGMDKPLKRCRLSEVPAIQFPEDRLIESFHARNPEVRCTL